jgi:hypothetical protein
LLEKWCWQGEKRKAKGGEASVNGGVPVANPWEVHLSEIDSTQRCFSETRYVYTDSLECRVSHSWNALHSMNSHPSVYGYVPEVHVSATAEA